MLHVVTILVGDVILILMVATGQIQAGQTSTVEIEIGTSSGLIMEIKAAVGYVETRTDKRDGVMKDDLTTPSQLVVPALKSSSTAKDHVPTSLMAAGVAELHLTLTGVRIITTEHSGPLIMVGGIVGG